MSRTTGVKNGTQQQVSRRKRVITMLEQTLKRGTKTVKKEHFAFKQKQWSRLQEQLSDKDIVRIKKELEILKSSI